MDNKPDPYDEFMVKLESIVQRVGWAIQGAGASDTTSQYAYTVGLSPAHPELRIRALDFPTMQAILNELAERIVSGLPLPVDTPLLDVIGPRADGIELPFLILPQGGVPGEDWSVARRWHREHGRLMFHRQSVLWPDNKGRLPTELECDPQIVALQEPW